jgi:hypothetical protein
MTRAGNEWECEDCGDIYGRHDLWFEGKAQGRCISCQDSIDDAEIRKEVSSMLMKIFSTIGIDKPNNFDEILTFCYDDVIETADLQNWHSGDVAIAFRRWIEDQAENKQ